MDRNEKMGLVSSLVAIRGGQYCAYCNKPLSFDEITIDHITPIADGGTWDTSNLCMSCFDCNNKKGNDALVLPRYRKHGPNASMSQTAMGSALDNAIAEHGGLIKLSEPSKAPKKPSTPKPKVEFKPLFNMSESWPDGAPDGT